MMIPRILLTAVFATAFSAGAWAQAAVKPTQIGTFNTWTVWSYNGTYNGAGQGKVCYLYAEPSESTPARLDHGRVSFSITSSPASGVENESNFIAGYDLAEQSAVTVDIDGKKFTMFTQGDAAWLLNKAEEPQLLEAMKAGRTMTISAKSRRGNPTTYSYSLSGVTAATNKIEEECSS